jgi:hypothetical protein
MTIDKRKTCMFCAWRANCAKRFSMGADAGLYCPDFSEDVTLRKHHAETGETQRKSDDA